MITTKMTGEMVREFRVATLQEIGIAAQRFVNILDDANDKPWKASEMAREDLMALRALTDACKWVIARQMAHDDAEHEFNQDRDLMARMQRG